MYITYKLQFAMLCCIAKKRNYLAKQQAVSLVNVHIKGVIDKTGNLQQHEEQQDDRVLQGPEC